MAYRKDIDGIRAIAIILVVFYHLGVSQISGGLLGVDVFFVISGFLITSIIYREIHSGEFSIKTFYLRRIRRILPALIVVLFCSSFFAPFALMPHDLSQYGYSVVASLMSCANIFFWKFMPTGYFAPNISHTPLIHLWSLGVEEQFYIFWPLLLLLFAPLLSRKLLLALCIVGIFFSFASAEWLWIHDHTSAAFYSPTSRAFELLMGSALAICEGLCPKLPKQINHIFSLIGLGLIFATACLSTPNNHLSALFQFLACTGTLILIYSGMHQNGIANTMLKFPPLRFIGLISYSLYLWHWPIIAFAKDFNIPMTAESKILILLISVALSVLTWKFIETPFRKNKIYTLSKSIIFFFIIPLAISIIFAVVLKLTHGLESRLPPTLLKQYQESLISGYQVLGNCFNGIPGKPAPEDNCKIGDLSQQKAEVLLVGDSHAAADINMLSVLLKNAHLKGYVITQMSTLYLPGIDPSFFEGFDEGEEKSQERNTAITKIIKQQHFKYVVLAGLWSAYNNNINPMKVNASEDANYSQLQQGLENAIKLIIQQSGIPVVILDTPPPLTYQFGRFNQGEKINRAQVEVIQGPSRRLILDLKQKYPSLLLIDPSKVLCSGNDCTSIINGVPVYFDNINLIGIHNNGHLTAAASQEIGSFYLEQYQNPFSARP